MLRGKHNPNLMLEEEPPLLSNHPIRYCSCILAGSRYTSFYGMVSDARLRKGFGASRDSSKWQPVKQQCSDLPGDM